MATYIQGANLARKRNLLTGDTGMHKATPTGRTRDAKVGAANYEYKNVYVSRRKPTTSNGTGGINHSSVHREEIGHSTRGSDNYVGNACDISHRQGDRVTRTNGHRGDNPYLFDEGSCVIVGGATDHQSVAVTYGNSHNVVIDVSNPFLQRPQRGVPLEERHMPMRDNYTASSTAHSYERRHRASPHHFQNTSNLSSTLSSSRHGTFISPWWDLEKRLETFRFFPPTCPVLSQDLAEAGFIYTGEWDVVQCPFCAGQLMNWSPEDIPFLEHRRHFPHCSFVKGLAQTSMKHTSHRQKEYNNVPRPSTHMSGYLAPKQRTASAQHYSNGRPTGHGQFFNPRDELNAQRDVSVSEKCPLRKDMTIEHNRLVTFQNWPVDCCVGPEDLAKAGFYYTDDADRVTCAFCGGGVHSWVKGDSAWGEHVRHFPRCPFVIEKTRVARPKTSAVDILKNLGKETVQTQYQESVSKNTVQSRHLLKAEPNAKPHRKDFRSTSSRLEQDKIDEAMLNPIVLKVLEMGYPKDIVCRVIQKRLEDGSGGFSNLQTLLEALFVCDHGASKE